MLTIIFRSCSRPESQVHGSSRFLPKPELTIRSLLSVRRSLYNLNIPNQLIVVDDHSDETSIDKMKKLCDKFISIEGTGNSSSLKSCFDLADKDNNQLIYFVEDDYIHELTTIQEMVDNYFEFKKKLAGKDVAFFPLDCNDRYKPDQIHPCFIVPGEKRYWRTVFSTTGTLFLSRNVYKQYRNEFEIFSNYGVDPNVHEDVSINRIWRTEKSPFLFSPIPTLVYHIQMFEHLPLYTNFKPLWESLV